MTDKKLTFKERRAADSRQVLQDAIDAGALVSIRFDQDGPRVRVNLDRVVNHKAMALYIRYRNADASSLFDAAAALILHSMGKAGDPAA